MDEFVSLNSHRIAKRRSKLKKCWKFTRSQTGWAPVIAVIFLIASWLLLSRIAWSNLPPSKSEDTALVGIIPSEGDNPKRQDSMMEWKRKHHASILPSEAWDMYKVGCYTYMATGEIELINNHKTLRVLECKQRLPSVLVIGVRGCDSFILSKILGLHPSVISHSGSHFEWPASNLDAAVAKWKSRQPFSSRFQLTIEHSTEYGEENDYLDGILNHVVPNAKIVVMLRDPVDRVIAEYARTNRQMPNVTSSDYDSSIVQVQLNQEINDTISNKSLQHQYRKANSSNISYLQVDRSIVENNDTVLTEMPFIQSGIYVETIKKIRSIARNRTSNLLVIDRNDFVRNPLRTFHDLESFLGLQPFFRDRHFQFDEMEGSYCVNVERRPDTHCVYEDEITERHLPVIDEEFIDKLSQFYEKHDNELVSILGRNLSWMQ